MEPVQIAIVFLDKTGFSVYVPTLETPLRFNFTKETIQDMEVINTEGFLTQITEFLTKYQFPPSLVTILISQDLLFIQDIPTIISLPDESTPPQQISAMEQQKKIQDFLDTVPFEVIESKAYPIEGGIRVAATNKALYQDLIIVFEKLGSTVKAVIPAFILGIPNEGLSDETITAVINNGESLRQESFMVHEQKFIPLTSEEKKKQFLSLPKQQTKLYAYTGVFVVLLGVLGFMYKTMSDQNAADQKNTLASQPSIVNQQQTVQNTPIAAVTTPTIASVPVGSIVASTSAISKSTINIQVQTNVTTATQGQLIRNKLVERGYTNVIISATAPTTAKTLIEFSPSIDVNTQADITNVISNIFTNFSAQQGTQAQYNVSIIPSANP